MSAAASAPRLLVRTPPQHALESPAGYVLRVSEANGYATPRNVFDLAVIPRDEMFTLRLNMRKLSAVLACRPQDLHGYATDGPTGLAIALCGHDLSDRQLAPADAGFCPECVVEYGFIPAWTNLRFVDGCPFHKRELLHRCWSCKRLAEWFRPGLLRCKCGEDLSEVRTRRITDDHAALLHQVVAKFTGKPVDNMFGFPAEQFSAMSLTRLLAMADYLGRLRLAAPSGKVGSTAESAAFVLSNWPKNLYPTLQAILIHGQRGSPKANFRHREEMLYRAWLASVGTASDTAFIRETLAGFQADATYDVTLPGRTDDLDGAKGANANGNIEEVRRKRSTRLATGAPKKLRPPAEPGFRTFPSREAARRLGLSQQLLKALRQMGHFEVQNKASHIAAFHEADILAFEHKVLNLPISAQPKSLPIRSLREVLTLKLKYANAKAELVAAVLDGKIQVLGYESNKISDLLLDRTQVDEFIAQARSRAFGGTLTQHDAGKMLHCSSMVVPGLVAAGHLRAWRGSTGLRVDADSVQEFKLRYQSLSGLAARQGTLSRWLQREASKAGVQLLLMPRGPDSPPQPFVRVEDIEALKLAREVHRPISTSIISTMTFAAAAGLLECTATVVPKLVAAGHLTCLRCGRRVRIVQSSVDDFLSRYRSVARIAREHRVGPAKILNEASTHNIHLLAIPRGGAASPQYFMYVKDAETLTGPYEAKVSARLRKSLAAKERRSKS